jgi:chromodomain-helicase-DNA-binding protein 7
LQAIYERNTAVLQQDIARKANAPRLVNLAMELRKCCNHPYLVKGVEQREAETIAQELKTNGKLVLAGGGSGGGQEGGEAQQLQLRRQDPFEEAMVAASGKLVLLDKLLPKLRAEGHKVLVFSQFKMMLELLQVITPFFCAREFQYKCVV